MAWTAPRTWVTSEVVTAAIMNAHVRDNFLWAAFHHGCRAYKSASQTVGIGANDVISFNTEEYDTDTIHSTVTNNSRFAAPVSGYYRVQVSAAVDADGANHNGRMVLNIRKNAAGASGGGTSLVTSSFDVHANTQSADVEWEGFLTAGDYVECFFLSATEARDLTSGADGTALTIAFTGF